ncbi:MAG TPA: hypothetical protein VMV77_21375 [Bacteroidales bacterium]|nr:hypothetical protein [Bacteroidales bacterium]
METKINASNKRDRFIRIVEKRVNNILQNLDSLANCANKRNYEYSEKDVKIIFNEIDRKVKEIKGKFENTSSRRSNFRLNS